MDDPPSAVLCFNDMLMNVVFKALREANYHVPRDCSVAGIDDIPYAAYTYPPLTTFRQPKYQIGFKATQMMAKMLNIKQEKVAI